MDATPQDDTGALCAPFAQQRGKGKGLALERLMFREGDLETKWKRRDNLQELPPESA